MNKNQIENLNLLVELEYLTPEDKKMVENTFNNPNFTDVQKSYYSYKYLKDQYMWFIDECNMKSSELKDMEKLIGVFK